MVEIRINKMLKVIENMKQSIVDDIEDIKKAKHENLLNRNDIKQQMIDELESEKVLLNEDLVEAVQQGVDINSFKILIDKLESELKELYTLNYKLGTIVLPIKEMYKEIVDEISENNGGNLIDIKV